MRSKTYVWLIAIPAIAYLLVLLLVGILVGMPALGWYGLGVATVLVLLVAGAAIYLYPRTRANAPRLHPRLDEKLRLLVVADAHTSNEAFVRAVDAAASKRPAEVFVVAPLLADPLHYLTDDDDGFQEDARARLIEALLALARAEIDARGVVGSDDPLTAVGDALATFPATEILLLAPEAEHRAWLESDLELRIRDLYGIHVSSRAVNPTHGTAAAR